MTIKNNQLFLCDLHPAIYGEIVAAIVGRGKRFADFNDVGYRNLPKAVAKRVGARCWK